MTERIKLTEDDIKKKFWALVDNELDDNFDWNCFRVDDMIKILEWKEKAEKWNALNESLGKEGWVSLENLIEKNKQLKVSIENLENANEMWKERAEGFVELANMKADLMIENTNLKQKLEKIEELPVKFPCKHYPKFCCDYHVPMNELKEILKENK